MKLTKYEEAFIANAVASGEVIFADNTPIATALITLVREHAKQTPPLSWIKKINPQKLVTKIEAMPPQTCLNVLSTAIEMLANASNTKINQNQDMKNNSQSLKI